jgi:molybdenum cofactor guanylyltransferase
MQTLGAIIAGGQSRRFGDDKAAARLDGKALLAHVADGLRSQVDGLVVVGRQWPGFVTIADVPAPGMGPLGGLCGGLRHAAESGFEWVVTMPCDLLPVPDFADLEGAGPRHFLGHYLAARWPAALAPELEGFLRAGNDRSVRGWIAACDSQPVVPRVPLANLNSKAALAAFAQNRVRDGDHDAALRDGLSPH